MKVDYLIVGAGLTGATIARTLQDCGLQVMVVEKRSQLAGNCHDQVHSSGIRYHTYGPHFFRTTSERIWDWVQRFSEFYSYHHRVKSLVDNKYENWPISTEYLKRACGANWNICSKANPANFEEACLAKIPKQVYEKFIKEYSEKQWGKPAHLLEVSLAGRFDVRHENDSRLFRHKYQGLPRKGYANFVLNLLNGVPVILNCDYLKERNTLKAGKLVIYTGAIDEFYSYDLGRLQYRAQQRIHEYLPESAFELPAAVVNNPSSENGRHVRTIEWKQIMEQEFAKQIRGTLLTRETPINAGNSGEYEYPFPDNSNQSLYKLYRERAEHDNKLLFCGRLGEYRYLDMDQAIGRAMMLAQEVLVSAGLSQAVDLLQETVKDFRNTKQQLEKTKSQIAKLEYTD